MCHLEKRWRNKRLSFSLGAGTKEAALVTSSGGRLRDALRDPHPHHFSSEAAYYPYLAELLSISVRKVVIILCEKSKAVVRNQAADEADPRGAGGRETDIHSALCFTGGIAFVILGPINTKTNLSRSCNIIITFKQFHCREFHFPVPGMI